MHSATRKCFVLLLGGVALGFVRPALGQTADAIIAKARAYVGSEAALDAVTSIHFIGVMEPGKLAPGAPQPPKVSIEVIFQKPYQQRIEVKGADTTDTTALDGYAAWQQTLDTKDPNSWKLSVLSPDQIKRLRARTWENLSFYKGIDRCDGSVENLGPATVDGRPAVKLAFRHDADIVFFRYFDPETGKLLLTETEQGGSIREEGEIIVDGLRFAKRITQTLKGTDAKGQAVEQQLVMSFDRITLNEKFPESDFEMPFPSQSSQAPTADTGAAPVPPETQPQPGSPPNVPAAPATAK